jgi:hypothetical protein
MWNDYEQKTFSQGIHVTDSEIYVGHKLAERFVELTKDKKLFYVAPFLQPVYNLNGLYKHYDICNNPVANVFNKNKKINFLEQILNVANDSLTKEPLRAGYNDKNEYLKILESIYLLKSQEFARSP